MTNGKFSVEYMDKTDFQKSRAFSPGVITQGGRIVWLAGQTAGVDLDGKPVLYDFDAQARACFGLIDRTLKKAGGSVRNIVTMTVFICDARHGDRLVELRKEFFPDGNYPGSALLTITGFAQPGLLIEIQGIAVIPD